MSGLFDNPRVSDNRYLLEIDSLVVGVFKEAANLENKIEYEELEEGGAEMARKLVGPYAQGTFLLREGVSDDAMLYEWFEKSDGASVFASSRRTGNVILVDGRGEELMRWRFRMALITSWEGPRKRPRAGKAYEIESMAVTHEGLETIFRPR